MLIRVMLAGKDALSGPLRSGARSSAVLREGIKAARDQVKSLERAQRDLANRRDFSEALDNHRMKIAAQSRVVDQLRDAYAAADRPSKQLTKNYEEAHHKLARLNREEDQHLDKLRAVEARLETAGLATGDYGELQERLRRDIARTNDEIGEQDNRLKQLAATQRRQNEQRQRFNQARNTAGSLAAGGATAIAGGGAVIYGLNRAAGDARDLQADMTTIAQRTNMSADAAARFEDRLLAISTAANQTREETTAIFDNLSAQGFDPNDALQMGAAVARATTAYREDSGDVSNAAGSLRNIGLAANQTGRALDVMALAGKRGNFEFGDMARALPGLTAQAAAFGMTGLEGLADISAAAQIVRRGAGSADEAGTNLSNLLQKIGSPETARRFAAVGINLRTELQRGEAAGVSALETIIELTRRATGGDASLLGNFYEDAQVQKAVRPLMAAVDEYRAIRVEALGAAGVVDSDFARRMLDDAEGVEALKISAQLASLVIGRSLSPTIAMAGRVAKRATQGFVDWAKANPAWAKGVAIGALVVAALTVGVGALAIGAAAVLVPLAAVKLSLALLAPSGAAAGGGFFAAARGAWAFTAALLANPVTWIVLAIVAAVALLAGAAFLIWKNWKPISTWFGRMWSGLVGLINNYTPMGVITRNWGPITAFFGATWRLAGQMVGLGLDYIKLAILRFTPLGFLIRNWGTISSFFTGVWNGAKLAVDLGISTIKNAIANFAPLQDFIRAFASTWTWFADLPGRFFTAGANAVNGLIQGIRGQRAAVQAETASVASGMVDTTARVHDTHSPSRVFAALGAFAMDGLALGIRRGSISPVAQMRAAAAAVVAAGALGGAGAPALASTPLLSARPPAAPGSGLAGATIEIHVHVAAGADARETGASIAQAVADEMRRLEREAAARGRSSLDDDGD